MSASLGTSLNAPTLKLSITPYTLPLSHEVNTSTTSAATRSGWRLALHDTGSGLTGWGEAASWPGFGGGAPLSQVSLEALCDPQHPALVALTTLPLTEPSEPLCLEALKRACAHVACREARHALELAALDLSARAAGLPLARHLTLLLAQHLKRPVSTSLPTSLTMSAPTHALIRSLLDARRALYQGYSALKLKVGVSPLWAEEGLKVARLRALLDREAPHAELRLDANGAWQSHDALAALIVARAYEVSWVEEPLRLEVFEREGHVKAWRDLTAHQTAPIGLDEGLCVAERPHEHLLIALEAGVRVVTLKPMFLGGLITTAELAARAHDAGARLCITHALEGAIGRRGATHLCAALNALGVHSEGGLEGALVGDLLPALKVQSGRVMIPEEPGLGQLPEALTLSSAPRGVTSARGVT